MHESLGDRFNHSRYQKIVVNFSNQAEIRYNGSFFRLSKFFNLFKFGNVSFGVFRVQIGCTMVKILSPKLTSFKHFYYKKGAVVPNLCLLGKTHQNPLTTRMIESVPKTFMPIQTLVLHSELIELQIGWSQRSAVRQLLVLHRRLIQFCL